MNKKLSEMKPGDKFLMNCLPMAFKPEIRTMTVVDISVLACHSGDNGRVYINEKLIYYIDEDFALFAIDADSGRVFEMVEK